MTGIIINFYGPEAGRHADSWLFYRSAFDVLFERALQSPEDDNFCGCGDSAYGRGPRLAKPYPKRGSTETTRAANDVIHASEAASSSFSYRRSAQLVLERLEEVSHSTA